LWRKPLLISSFDLFLSERLD